jgi:predicted O-methyltransferase YrrM
MQRYEILNNLIKKHNYKTYLEIGTQFGQCFTQIDLPRNSKYCVDIQKNFEDLDEEIDSDGFFEKCDKTYDIIFIDGDHSYKQSLKDVLNALKFLNEGGSIVCHDCYPETIRETALDCKGTVYGTILNLRMSRNDLEIYVIDSDCGVGVIKKGKSETIEKESNVEFEKFIKEVKYYLNLISVEEFKNLLCQ